MIKPVSFMEPAVQGGLPPWQEWLDLVNADSYDDVSEAEAARLRQPQNLSAWLRALHYLLADTDAVMATASRHLAGSPKRPLNGQPPNAEYQIEKKAHDELHGRRLHYKRHIEGRIAECKHLLAASDTSRRDTGEMWGLLIKVEELLERDDLEGALSLLKNMKSQNSPAL